MTDRDDLAEQLVDLIDNAATPIAFDDVIERARLQTDAPHPRRARRLVVAGVALVLIAASAAAAIAVNARNTTTRPEPRIADTTTTAASTETTTPIVRSDYTNAIPTGEMGGLGPFGMGWRLDGNSLSRTDDDGKTWRDITPPLAVNQDPIARINWVEFLDEQHVWVPVAVNHAPFTIYRSDNGGDSWEVVCAGKQCGGGATARATFLDQEHGWGLGYAPDGGLDTGVISVTSDGGHSWTALGLTPFVGPMHFLDRMHGWAVSEPGGYGSRGLATKPGGDLYRTDDGGRTWHLFKMDVGNQLHFGVPDWFGDEGVVGAWSEPDPESGQHDQVRVYTTHNGGNTWRGQVVPVADDASDRYGNQPTLQAPELPFSASSMRDWMLFIGPNAYMTHDAGATWETNTSSPAIGPVYSLDLMWGTWAWALASVPVCDDPASTKQSCRLEVLVHTTDGGRNWPVLPTPPAPTP